MNETKKQYNVLIVDDEIFIRNGLSDIFHKHYPNWNVVGCATSYQEAYEIFRSQHIDLLITDIQMPEKNGLELIEDLRKEKPNLEIIIISGYDNFAYARRAMSNKVIHYLLKPINLTEFHTALKQLEETLAHKESTSHTEEIRNIQYTNSTINGILNGDAHTEQLLSPLLSESLLPYALICIDMYQEESLTASPIVSIQTELHDIFKKTGNFYFSKCLVFFRNKHLWTIIIPGNEITFVYDFVSELKTLLYDTFSIRASFGVSAASEHIKDFSDCFRQAYIASRSFLVETSAFPLKFYHAENYADHWTYDINAETKITNNICSGNLDEANKSLQEFISSFFLSNPDIFMITKAVQRLSYSIMKSLEKSFTLDRKFMSQFETLQDLSNIHTKQQLYKAISLYIEYSCNLFQTLFSNRQSRIVQYIMQFIQEFYYKDLSLDILAEKVEVSPNYLSTHFKAETGMNVVEYLTFIRLEKAKDMLQNSHMKIHQIAEEIGYHDAKYFNRIFKKNIGVTPNEYRSISNIQ